MLIRFVQSAQGLSKFLTILHLCFSGALLREKLLLNETLKKVAPPQEKAQCVSWFIEEKLKTQTQRNYRIKYGRHTPSHPSISVHGTRN